MLSTIARHAAALVLALALSLILGNLTGQSYFGDPFLLPRAAGIAVIVLLGMHYRWLFGLSRPKN
jgi:hypothetical protein